MATMTQTISAVTGKSKGQRKKQKARRKAELLASGGLSQKQEEQLQKAELKLLLKEKLQQQNEMAQQVENVFAQKYEAGSQDIKYALQNMGQLIDNTTLTGASFVQLLSKIDAAGAKMTTKQFKKYLKQVAEDTSKPADFLVLLSTIAKLPTADLKASLDGVLTINEMRGLIGHMASIQKKQSRAFSSAVQNVTDNMSYQIKNAFQQLPFIKRRQNYQIANNQYETQLKGVSQQNLKVGYLSAFPQWLYGEGQKRKTAIQKWDQGKKLLTDIKQKQSEYYTKMSQLGRDQATWDDATKRWVGAVPTSIETRLGARSERIAQKTSANRIILAQTTSQGQVIKQVPSFIKKLVAYNSAISNTGFGKISQGSSNLYAGRWIDDITGNIRMMPKPSPKFLDPFDVEPHLGYLQAKVLYNWDELLSANDELERLKTTTNFKQKAINRTMSALNIQKDTYSGNQQVNNMIKGWLANPTTQTGRGLILSTIGQTALIEFYNSMPKVTKLTIQGGDSKQGKAQSQRLRLWNQMVQQAQGKLITKIGTSKFSKQTKAQLTSKVNRAFVAMTALVKKRVLKALNDLQKNTLFNRDVDERTAQQARQKWMQDSQRRKDMIQGTQFIGPQEVAKLADLRRLATVGLTVGNREQRNATMMTLTQQFDDMFKKNSAYLTTSAKRSSTQDMWRKFAKMT